MRPSRTLVAMSCDWGMTAPVASIKWFPLNIELSIPCISHVGVVLTGLARASQASTGWKAMDGRPCHRCHDTWWVGNIHQDVQNFVDCSDEV